MQNQHSDQLSTCTVFASLILCLHIYVTDFKKVTVFFAVQNILIKFVPQVDIFPG